MSSSLQCVANVSHKIHNEKHIYHICLQICCSRTVGKQQTSTSYIPCYFQQSFRYVFPFWHSPLSLTLGNGWTNVLTHFAMWHSAPFQHLNTCFHYFKQTWKNIYSPCGLSTQGSEFNIKHIRTTWSTKKVHQLIPNAWGKQRIMWITSSSKLVYLSEISRNLMPYLVTFPLKSLHRKGPFLWTSIG